MSREHFIYTFPLHIAKPSERGSHPQTLPGTACSEHSPREACGRQRADTAAHPSRIWGLESL